MTCVQISFVMANQGIQRIFCLKVSTGGVGHIITWRTVNFFSKLNYYFFGYFDPINIFFDNKNKYFSG